MNGFSFSIIFLKSSILDIWQDSDFSSEPSNNLREKLHLGCLAGSWIHLCINHFRKTVAYLFTKFDSHIPPYIKQYSVGHGQIHSTFASQPCVSKDYALNAEVHLVPSQTSTMDLFSKIKKWLPRKNPATNAKQENCLKCEFTWW